MKKIFILIETLYIAISASAQTSHTESTSLDQNNNPICKNYFRIYADGASTKEKITFSGFDGASKATDEANKDIDPMWGFNAGFLYGFNITGKRIPLFVEAGLEFEGRWRSGSKNESHTTGTGSEGTETKTKDKLMRWGIPVNISYKFRIGKHGGYIAPYAGMRLTWNFVASESVDITKTTIVNSNKPGHFWDYKKTVTCDNYEYDRLSDDKEKNGMDCDKGWNALQFGGQVGLTIGNKFICLSVGYQWDGTIFDYSKKDYEQTISTHGLRVGMGVNF